MSAKEYPIINPFGFTKVLSQVNIPGFSYFGRFFLMPKYLCNVYIALKHFVNKFADFVFKIFSPPVFIINY